jgi:uncharacterized protein
MAFCSPYRDGKEYRETTMQDLLLTTDEQRFPGFLRYQKRKRLEVILKIAERCNIDCSYCYFFHGGDNSFRVHPASMSKETIDGVATFVRDGISALGVKKVQIILHGGEPLLLGKARFAKLCEQLGTALGTVANLTFSIQTNATLIDEAWIGLFERYHVEVGVSMDGPAEYHDVARIDFKGRGTYDRVRRGVTLLQQAASEGRIEKPGVLCVINPAYSVRTIYCHFVDELGFESIDFLLPDDTYESIAKDVSAKSYGQYLCDLFDLWTEQNNPAIHIRVLASVFSLLLGGPSLVSGYGTQLPGSVVIGSHGGLGPDDALRACGEQISQTSMTIKDTTLEEYLKSPFVTKLENAYYDISETCQKCCWANVCGGGWFVNRYRKDIGFKNPSLFCEGLKMFYAHAASYLLAKGLSFEALQKNLQVGER